MLSTAMEGKPRPWRVIGSSEGLEVGLGVICGLRMLTAIAITIKSCASCGP